MGKGLRWVGLGLAASLLAGSSVRGDDEKDDLKKMQGTWVSKGTESFDESQWVFKGDTLKVTSPKRNYETTVSLDTKDKPRQIDFKINDGPADAQGKTSLGVYKFDGDDTLTIGIGGEPNHRPESFDEERGTAFYFVLKPKN